MTFQESCRLVSFCGSNGSGLFSLSSHCMGSLFLYIVLRNEISGHQLFDACDCLSCWSNHAHSAASSILDSCMSKRLRSSFVSSQILIDSELISCLIGQGIFLIWFFIFGCQMVIVLGNSYYALYILVASLTNSSYFYFILDLLPWHLLAGRLWVWSATALSLVVLHQYHRLSSYVIHHCAHVYFTQLSNAVLRNLYYFQFRR